MTVRGSDSGSKSKRKTDFGKDGGLKFCMRLYRKSYRIVGGFVAGTDSGLSTVETEVFYNRLCYYNCEYRSSVSMSSQKGSSSPKNPKSSLKKASTTSPTKLPVPPASKPDGSGSKSLSPTKQRKTSNLRKYQLGDHVQINYNDEVDIWVHGIVTNVHSDTPDTYDITYDDGFIDVKVSNIYIRLESDTTPAWLIESGTEVAVEQQSTTAPTDSNAIALQKQIESMQKTIDDLRKAAVATDDTTSSANGNSTSGSKSPRSEENHNTSSVVDSELDSLSREKLLEVALSLKNLVSEKTALHESLGKQLKVTSKTSEDVIAKLKKEITDMSKKGNSKAAAANAQSAADAMEASAKENAAWEAQVDELKSTISELTGRLEAVQKDKKSTESDNDRIAKSLRASEERVATLQSENSALQAKLETHSATGDQTQAHVAVLSKEKEELEKAKKAANKEIQSLKKQCDEFKETADRATRELDEFRVSNESLAAEMKEFRVKHGADAQARNKLLTYFDVGLRCEVLMLVIENKKTAAPVWSSGRISKRNDDSTFNVVMDDGTSKSEIPPENMRIIMNVGPLLLNDRVELDVRGSYFPAKISKCNLDGTYTVYCDNGSIDSKVPIDGMRLIVPPASSSLSDLYQVNDLVIVNYQGRGIWYCGTIGGINETSFTINFDFGETDPNVPITHIRAWCSPQNTINCPICAALARISRQVDDCKKYIKELQAAHEMATEGASSTSLESNRLKYLVSNAWIYVSQESKILTDCINDMQQFFPTDALMNHSSLPFGTIEGGGHGKQASKGQTSTLEPISKEKFDKLKREKIEEERRRRMVLEEERRQAEKARRLAEETFAGETIRKAATKNEMNVLVPLVERWSGDKVLSQGYDNNITPVWAAAERGNTAALELLLTHGASFSVPDIYGSTAVSEAAANGHEKVLALLIKAGADINQPNNDGCSPIYRAVGNGHKGTVAMLIKAGADIQKPAKSGRTPVGMAAWTGMSECLELLLEKKADCNKADKDMWTPVFAASANNHIECLDLLLRAKADLTLVNNKQQTPLYIASKNGHVRVCAKLIEKGVKINAQDQDGDTAIYAAAQEGHIEVLKLLVDNSADILLANKNGLTPSKIAAQSFQAEAVNYLKVVEAEEMERLRKEADSAKKELAEIKAKMMQSDPNSKNKVVKK